MTQSDLAISIRAIIGKKTSRATTNSTDTQSLAQTLERAFDLAKLQDPNPDLLPLPSPQTYRRVRSYSTKTARATPADRAQAVKDAVRICRRKSASAAGAFSTGESLLAVANSKGLFAAGRSTLASFGITVQLDDISGWAEGLSTDVAKLDAPALARRALAKAMAAANPKPIQPGPYEVILEPAAVADLIIFLGLSFNAMAYLERRSPLTGKLGKLIFGKNFSLLEDPYHALLPGRPFDFEGTRSRRVELIRNGVLSGLLHDRLTAKKMRTKTTGNALVQPAPDGPSFTSLVVNPGKTDLPEMISKSKRAILVTHLHYTNLVDMAKLYVTGMTRDGTFLVEKGKISRPLRNLRFTHSLFDAFSNVLDVGRAQHLCAGFFGGGVVATAMRIKDFNFSSETEF